MERGTWDDIPAFAKPVDPATEASHRDKTKVWDMWLTDYDPLFHSHIFEGCPLNNKGKGQGQKSSFGEEGKSSTEEGKEPGPSLGRRARARRRRARTYVLAYTRRARGSAFMAPRSRLQSCLSP